MKKNNFLLLQLILFTSPFFACDVCGCFMGITPYDNQSSTSLLYRYRAFNGYALSENSEQHHHLFPGNLKVNGSGSKEKNTYQSTLNGSNQFMKTQHGGTSNNTEPEYQPSDYEIYRTVELREKYFIHPRVELNAIAPLILNSTSIDKNMTSAKGIGDLTFFTGYHLIKRIEVLSLQQRLIVGIGIKLPTGNNNRKDESEIRLPFLLQTGTGSLDYFGYTNYIIAYKKLGASINCAYKLNGANSYQEKIRNSLTTYFNLFYKIPLKNWMINPSAQVYYEHTNGIEINTILVPGTQMNVAMAGTGVDIFYKNYSLNFVIQLPFYEEIKVGNLYNSGRIVVGINYSFNQRNYLLLRSNEE